MRRQKTSHVEVALRFVILVAATTLGGCGGGDGGNGVSMTPVKIDIAWGARSRIVNAPSSALSATVTLTGASSTSTDLTFTVNRDPLPAAYTRTYTSPTAARTGTWPLSVKFFAQADGGGAVVGTAGASVTIQPDGSGIGDITTTGTVASVEVPAGQSVKVGETKELLFTAKDASNAVLVVSPGSVFIQVTAGQDKLHITGGQLQGVVPGPANITASVDGKMSPATSITVLATGTNALWVKFRGDLLNTGRVGGSGATGVQKWVFAAGDTVLSSAAIGPDGTVYIGSGSTFSTPSRLYALDGTTGTKKWDALTGGAILSSPCIGVDGTVYMGSADHRVYAFDGQTGAKKWDFLTGGIVDASPTVGPDGTVYVGSYDQKIYALNGATGAKKWQFTAANRIEFTCPALTADGTLYVACQDATVYALDSSTGTKKWQSPLLGTSLAAAPAVGPDGTIYIGGGYASAPSTFYALNKADGSIKWQFATPGGMQFASAAVSPNGMVYVSASKLFALDAATGTKKWEFGGTSAADKISEASPAIGADGTVYVVGGDFSGGHLIALDGTTGAKHWDFVMGSVSGSSPAIGPDGMIYLGAGDKNVYAIH